jgi:hypothetical protein
VIHIRELPGVGSSAQLSQGSIVQHGCDGVSGLNHDQTNRASAQVVAIGARTESGDGGAGDGSERAIKNPDDRSDSDIVRGTGKRVAAPSPFFRIDKPGMPQLGQDMIEEFFRDYASGCDGYGRREKPERFVTAKDSSSN